MTAPPPTPGQALSEADVSLLPCPFCGGEAWLNDYEAKYSDLPPKSRAPQCRSCGASLGYLTTPAKAIAAWNRRPHAPASDVAGGVEREAVAILKGTGKINGDGWKDTTTKGEVVYVWNAEKPAPYAPGQYPRIGNEGWSASTSQYDFEPATSEDVPAILALIRPAAPDAPGGGAGGSAVGLERWEASAKGASKRADAATDKLRAAVEALEKIENPRSDFDLKHPRSVARQTLAALASQPPATGGAVERDYPAEFEAWWATYKHRNRLVADYPVKKQIAFDAFHHAATQPAPSPGVDWDRTVNFGFQTDEPSLREMVTGYYRSHSMPDPMALADKYVSLHALPAAPSIQKGDEG